MARKRQTLFAVPIEEQREDAALAGVYALIAGLQAGGTELRMQQARARYRSARRDTVIRWTFMWATIASLVYVMWAGIHG